MTVLSIQAGPKALAHLREHGLCAGDIGVVPAAAGGPKGLIFQQLDKWLFGSWLPSAPRQRTLIGSSIGAWRMAAACHADPAAAFQRLGDLYCRQRYPAKPSPALVTDACRRILADFLRGHETEITSHPCHRLHILAARGSRLLAAPRGRIAKMAGFGAAVLGNLVSRARLARHLERVVVGDARDPIAWLKPGFDAFHTHFAPLSSDNLEAALLASGTLPFVMEPVRELAHAPAGTYWDGGLIDYHPALPYSRMGGGPEGGLVLFPHFEERIVPGWFDKSLPWRHAATGEGRGWLDNVILVSPSRSFLQTLPRGKLPDRKDFIHYGPDHDLRILKWRQAMAEGERLRDALASFIEKPDLGMVRTL
jgi:hypothetical protein